MPVMRKAQRGGGSGAVLLCAQVLWAGLYGVPLYVLGTLAGSDTRDGVVGIVVGLYICSHPAANAVDVLFADRFAFRRVMSMRFATAWLLLNVLVLLTGWAVIFVGVLRFVRDFR